MDDVASDLTWFADRPGRSAGIESVSQLIRDWDGFGDENPNSALTFINSKGKSDTIIFEQERPSYNAKKNRLVSLITIHTDQELDVHREDSKSHLSKFAYDAKIGNNQKFPKRIDNASLFIDSLLSKWTSVDINNTSNGDVFIQQLDSDKPDWSGNVWGALEFGASLTFAVLCGPGAPACLTASSTFLATGAVRTINESNSAGYGPKGPDSTFVINKKNGKRNITDTDTEFGGSNGVADVPFLLNFVTQNEVGDDVMLPLGLFTFDNPIFGKAKATFSLFSETVPDGVITKSNTSPQYIYGNESGENEPGTVIPIGVKYLKKNIFKDLDISVKYLGDEVTQKNPGFSSRVMGWELNISGEVPDAANFEYQSFV